MPEQPIAPDNSITAKCQYSRILNKVGPNIDNFPMQRSGPNPDLNALQIQTIPQQHPKTWKTRTPELSTAPVNGMAAKCSNSVQVKQNQAPNDPNVPPLYVFCVCICVRVFLTRPNLDPPIIQIRTSVPSKAIQKYTIRLPASPYRNSQSQAS